jgi:pimeloyl-ACP methyl ester carboxylesterase
MFSPENKQEGRKKIYLISGLGADERVFNKLTLPGVECVPLPWLIPDAGETISHYAARMSEPVSEKNFLLMGVSFGGMMSIEISKLKAPEKIFLVSSVKTRNELPPVMRAASVLPVQYFIPNIRSGFFFPIENHFLGAVSEEERKLSNEFRRNVNPQYLRWAVHQVINWKNEVVPQQLLHIHGSADRTFPLKYIHPQVIIPGGTHFMIMNRADEISKIILDNI